MRTKIANCGLPHFLKKANSAAEIVKLCSEIAANINQKWGDCAAFSANFWFKLATALCK